MSSICTVNHANSYLASRFLNINPWSTRSIIRTVRNQILEMVLKTLYESGRGRRPLKASTIKWWGKRRWQIEGWFKTAKYRFGLHRFGQGTLLGMYRWLILSFIAYFIAHWTYLSTQVPLPPDWGEAAQTALITILPQMLVSLLLLDIERLASLALSCGFDINISRCKM